MRRRRYLPIIVTLALFASATSADQALLAPPMAYAAAPDTASNSYKLINIDLASGVSSDVGALGFVDVEGFAVAPEGTIYAVSDASKTLITVNPFSGRAVAVGSGVGNLHVTGEGVGAFDSLDLGLTFSCDGRLWMSSDTTGKFWRVDRNSGQATLIGNLGTLVSGLAATANGVFGISVGPQPGLYRINVDTATATAVGSLGGFAGFVDAGLDADSAGNLWAVLDYSPPQTTHQSDLVRIDVSTGLATAVSKTFPEVEGLAIGPVPACATGPGPGPAATPVPVNATSALLLMGLSLLSFGLIRRRAQS